MAERLRERRFELEQATLLRINAVSAMPRTSDPEYAHGLRQAVSVGLEWGLEGIERGEEATPPVPEALLAQARLAARSGVSLDTVLRRYLVGHTLLDDFLIEEAERAKQLDRVALKRLLRSQAAILDRLLADVAEAYTEEAGRRPGSAERRRTARIERLLEGEPLDTSGLGYDLDGWHLGVAVSGLGAEEGIEVLTGRVDCRLLVVPREEGALWAWLGSKRRLDPKELAHNLSRDLPTGMSLAFGEPGEGLSGWRLTHRQAQAALSVALRKGESPVRYREVALVASMLRDDVLATSLRALYLAPLELESDGGEALRVTLRSYFAHDRNVSSTAADLSVNRRTVVRRLQKIEEALDSPLSHAGLELEAALRLRELEPVSMS